MRFRLRPCLHRQSSCFLHLLFLLLVACPAAAGDSFPGKVIGIADGDTIEVLRDRHPVRIRLNGIDAPEYGQAFGNPGTTVRRLAGLRAASHSLEHGTDSYGRTIADVVLPDGRSEP